jgi:hypothetical protein
MERMAVVERGRRKEESERAAELQGVSFCSYWKTRGSRDVNTASNVKLVLLNMMKNGDRGPDPVLHKSTFTGA